MTTTLTGNTATDGIEVVRRQPRATPDTARRRARRRRATEIALATAVPLALLGLWQAAASLGWIDDRVYPAPTTTVESAIDLFSDGRLIDDSWATLKRLLAGFAIGSGLGLVVGFVMGASHWVRAALEPLMDALYVVPKLALLPIFITMFGLGDAPIIVLVAVSVFFYVWVGSMVAVASVDNGFRDSARSLGVSPWEMFRHVSLPAALPAVFVSLRIAMAVSVLVVVAAEFIIGGEGLGHLIFSARSLFINTWVYAGIAVVAIMGVALGGVVSWCGRRLTPWDQSRHRQQIP